MPSAPSGSRLASAFGPTSSACRARPGLITWVHGITGRQQGCRARPFPSHLGSGGPGSKKVCPVPLPAWHDLEACLLRWTFQAHLPPWRTRGPVAHSGTRVLLASSIAVCRRPLTPAQPNWPTCCLQKPFPRRSTRSARISPHVCIDCGISRPAPGFQSAHPPAFT